VGSNPKNFLLVHFEIAALHKTAAKLSLPLFAGVYRPSKILLVLPGKNVALSDTPSKDERPSERQRWLLR
jgi:hypothetical protein